MSRDTRRSVRRRCVRIRKAISGLLMAWLVLVFACGGAVSTTMRDVQLAEEAQMQKFALGIWYWIPMVGSLAETIGHFNSFADHNLNTVMATGGDPIRWDWSTEAGNATGMDVILGYMPSYINAGSWSNHASLHADVQNILSNIDTAAVSLKGYYLWDEPTSSDATNLGRLSQTFFEEDPLHPGMACLIGQSGISSCYSTMLPHDLLMIDVYGARAGGFLGNFNNMYHGGQDFTVYIDQARGNINALDDTPMWLVVQTHSCPGWNRDPTVNEIRCMNWLSLAHGARGLFWFIWQTSTSDWGNGLDIDTDEYDEIADFAADVRAMESTLTNLKVVSNIASVPAGDGESQLLTDLTMQDSGFRLSADATSVSDATASDGKAMRMYNDGVGWNIQWGWGNAGFSGSYTLRMRIRVQKNSNIGNAYTYGVWDIGSGTHVVGPVTKTASSASSSYVDITIGTFTPQPDQYVYVAEVNNASNVPYIYVDKMWFTGNGVKAYDRGDVQTLKADSPFIREDINAVAQDSSFHLWYDATRVADAAASDGYAACMYNDSSSWNIQWSWGDLGFVPGKEYDLWVRVKVDHVVPSPTGNAFYMGIYDPTSGTYPDGMLYCPASETADMVYKNIKVGTFVPQVGRGQCVFIAEANNASQISHVYVDKFWFVGRQTAQDSSFMLWNDATTVADSDASDGYAARMYNDGVGWNIQWTWGNNLNFEPNQKYTLYAIVKVDHSISGFTLPTGNAFKFGVWDWGISNFTVPDTTVPVSLSKDMVYRTYKIGTFVPNSNQYAYIAAADNEANVSYIYVDKFFFVPEGDTYIIPVNRNVVNSDGMTVSFAASAVDRYGDGNISATDVLTGAGIPLSGTTTRSFTQTLPPGGGMVVRLKSSRSYAR
jgi:hypothetical protein